MDLKKYKNIEFEDFGFNGNMPHADEINQLQRLLSDKLVYSTIKPYKVDIQMVKDALNLAKHLHNFTEEEIFEALGEKFPERLI